MKLYSEYIDTKLSDTMNLTKLDARSKGSFLFPYRLSSNDYKTVTSFIDWALNDNLGPMCLYNVFYDPNNKKIASRRNFNWLIKVPKSWNGYTEFYVKKEVMPLILLNWKDNGKQI